MLDCLQLLHFHIGSQIPSTSLLADGVGEAAQIYCELARLGANMRVIDIGGGLGIDYDGSHSGESDMSIGYNLDEYAATVVQAVQYACDRRGVRHPILCSESGRALVSHHSVLIFEAKSSTSFEPSGPGSVGANLAYSLDELADDARADYRNLMAAAVRGEYETCCLYIDQLKRRCVDLFKDGLLGLEHLAAVDALCDIVAKEIGASRPVRTYHVNLSLFTSIPDYWAIEQLFPVMPIHRLDQRPGVDGVLSDLTCDSDGKMNKFIGGATSLPLHEMSGGGGGGGGYYLGMFLGGAYQEALGGCTTCSGAERGEGVAQRGPPRVRGDRGRAGAVVRRRAARDAARAGDHVRAAQAPCGGLRGRGRRRLRTGTRFPLHALSGVRSSRRRGLRRRRRSRVVRGFFGRRPRRSRHWVHRRRRRRELGVHAVPERLM
ncbi:putative arginine decarboxylase 1 [Iris pallida]|uniref:Arginine decarboxylase n=1 Tax=Iris pallida TaxID=29817 RepID=A0AAX6IKW5_IRIPA|nr:putative arginine decarboxylase 1 [Iris pallida]